MSGVVIRIDARGQTGCWCPVISRASNVIYVAFTEGCLLHDKDNHRPLAIPRPEQVW